VLYFLRGSGDHISLSAIQEAADTTGIIDLRQPFAGFNLIVADLFATPPTAYFLTNQPVRHGMAHSCEAGTSVAGPIDEIPTTSLTSARATVVRVSPRVAHALSNSTLDDEAWAKVKLVRARLSSALAGLPTIEQLARTAPTRDAPAADGTGEAAIDVEERLARQCVHQISEFM
jgi:hypothetical protein